MNLYKYRALIRNMYNGDCNMVGNIIGNLHNVLEGHKINEISVQKADCKVIIEIDKEEQNNYYNIISKIESGIYNYISDNFDDFYLFDDAQKEDFINFINNNKQLLFEHFLVGNQITIIL